MSMLDSFFNKGFKGAKCKTLLKLTIPRIKLLRNRREIQIKQMRRDIAKLLETGQEATARIRVEHIIREENMMAAQEIIELFSELIAVRLPIIETQRECPLDLKEAISSICFAAPRCADLPELQQVQILFASKYGKEFVAAATELMPDCGVNRQLIELLSIRAPLAEVKLKLLKEIAEEHELDWDPAASETEFFKPPEDLLNGPTQFVHPSKTPLPKEKHDDNIYSSSAEASHEQSDSDSELDLGLPEVPKVSLRPISDGPDLGAIPPQVPLASYREDEPAKDPRDKGDILHEPGMEFDTHGGPGKFVAPPHGLPDTWNSERQDKQFLPFSKPTTSVSSARQSEPSVVSKVKSEVEMDLQDVLAAAHAAAESAERAATAARSAASLAEVRITELIKKKHENTATEDRRSEQLHHSLNPDESVTSGAPWFDHQKSMGDVNNKSYPLENHQGEGLVNQGLERSPSYEKPRMEEVESASPYKQESTHHQPQRLPSMEDDSYFSYPNLFPSKDPNVGSDSNEVDRF